jgi:hypothetical protein
MRRELRSCMPSASANTQAALKDIVSNNEISVSNINRHRCGLTTQKDSRILFKVSEIGIFTVTTEYNG